MTIYKITDVSTIYLMFRQIVKMFVGLFSQKKSFFSTLTLLLLEMQLRVMLLWGEIIINNVKHGEGQG